MPPCLRGRSLPLCVFWRKRHVAAGILPVSRQRDAARAQDAVPGCRRATAVARFSPGKRAGGSAAEYGRFLAGSVRTPCRRHRLPCLCGVESQAWHGMCIDFAIVHHRFSCKAVQMIFVWCQLDYGKKVEYKYYYLQCMYL